MSTLQERESLRALAASADESHGLARLARSVGRWTSLLAGQAMPLGATLALVWLATIGLVVVSYFVPFNLVSLVYMLPVVLAATRWGLALGIVAAIAGAAAADFFFYPPLYTFWIRDPQNVVDLVLFLLVAVVTSNLAARLKNETVSLQRREREVTELHAFSQALATCLTSRDLIFAVQDYLSNTLRNQAVLIASLNSIFPFWVFIPFVVLQYHKNIRTLNAIAGRTMYRCGTAKTVSGYVRLHEKRTSDSSPGRPSLNCP